MINVCSKCHDEIHAKKINVKGFIQTNKGVILDFKNVVNKQDNITGIDDKIKQLRTLGHSFTKILNIVNNEFNDAKITLYYIKKVLK